MTVEAVDFTKAIKEAEAAGHIQGGSGDYFKLKEGDNRIRLLTMCLPHPNTYKGEKRFQWLCYILDRKDGRVKPYFMQHTIYKQIAALQISEDYQFASVPMPYDITIHAVGAGTKEVKYTMIPARRETPLTAEELALLKAAKPLADLQKALNEKKDDDAPKPAAGGGDEPPLSDYDEGPYPFER